MPDFPLFLLRLPLFPFISSCKVQLLPKITLISSNALHNSKMWTSSPKNRWERETFGSCFSALITTQLPKEKCCVEVCRRQNPCKKLLSSSEIRNTLGFLIFFESMAWKVILGVHLKIRDMWLLTCYLLQRIRKWKHSSTRSQQVISLPASIQWSQRWQALNWVEFVISVFCVLSTEQGKEGKRHKKSKCRMNPI